MMRESNSVYKKLSIVIVTYNPDLKILHKMITHVSNKFQIIISDNNSSNINMILNIANFSKNIIVLKHSDNMGIAKAQNDAIRFLFDKKRDIDCICFLDQDSILENSNLVKMYYNLKKLENKRVAAIGTNFNGSKVESAGIISKNELISSGSVITKEAFLTIGLFMEELFIDFVDYEWCWRARKKGFNIYMDSSIFLEHQVGINNNNKRFNKIIISPKRLYFVYRNYLFLLKTKRTIKKENVVWLFKLFKQFVFNAFFCPQKLCRIKYIVDGCRDSLKLK